MDGSSYGKSISSGIKLLAGLAFAAGVMVALAIFGIGKLFQWW